MIFFMYALTWSSAVTAKVSHVIHSAAAPSVPIIVRPYFLTLCEISKETSNGIGSVYAVKSSAGYTPRWNLLESALSCMSGANGSRLQDGVDRVFKLKGVSALPWLSLVCHYSQTH